MSKTTNKALQLCPCGSAKSVAECCLMLINEGAPALNAEQLMRSRYTAYHLANADYIRLSWHVSRRPATLDLHDSPKWVGLKVLKVTPEKSGVAYVEFVAAFQDVANNRGQMHERSRFLKEDGHWFYVDGEQVESATPYQFSLPGRNEPCYCGSGRKYKKCCAKPAQA